MYPKTRETIARFGVGFALFMGVTGLFITFVPSTGIGWFGIAAFGAAIGLLSPSFRTRLFSLTLCAGLIWIAWMAHQEGLRYEEWLSTQPEELRPKAND